MAPLAVGVIFSLGFAETEPGEEIRVAGAGSALGSWDPDRAVSLSTDRSTYPRWSTAVVWFPLPGRAALPLRLEYKYVRDRRALDGSLAWEDGIPNRSVDLASCDTEATWLVNDLSWGSLEAALPKALDVLGCAQTPKLHKLCEAGLKRQLSPEWSGGSPEGADAGDADLAGTLFTPTCRNMCIPLHSPEVSGDPEQPQMAREESATSLHRWSVSSLPECETQNHPSSPSCSWPRGLSASQLPELDALGSSAAELSFQLRKNNSVSLLPECGDEGKGIKDAVAPTSEALAAFEAAYAIVGDKPMGEGSFGLVWTCRQRSAAGGAEPELRAVKRINKALLKPRDVDNLFGNETLEGEIHMHLRLKHRHVVAMHEVFHGPNIVSLVMECCRGGDLFDLITASGLGLPEVGAARALRHLLRALAFLHSLFIVHRDVKCENLLCVERGAPIEFSTFKLCDFGFAASLKGPNGHLKTRLGSPDAVAPEVVAGRRYSMPVDCWAAGVLLYMALSASSPFWDKTDTEVLRRVKRGEYSLSGPKWERISSEAKEVVRSLLTYSPEKRTSAAQALDLAWVGAMD